MRPRSIITATMLAAALSLTACSSDGDVAIDGDGDVAADVQTIVVTATDDACVVDTNDVDAGTLLLDVTNTGEEVTEVYVYGEGDRVVGEVENVTPGLSREFQVTVGGGEYEIACKPGMTGDGIRTDLHVTGEALEELVADRTVEFDGVDYDYEGLEGVTFIAGETVGFTMYNAGTVEHEFEVFSPDGVVLGEIGPTAVEVEGSVVLPLAEAGTYRYVCGIDDHEERGMVGEFEVTAG